jgi:hypothetical protein
MGVMELLSHYYYYPFRMTSMLKEDERKKGNIENCKQTTVTKRYCTKINDNNPPSSIVVDQLPLLRSKEQLTPNQINLNQPTWLPLL